MKACVFIPQVVNASGSKKVGDASSSIEKGKWAKREKERIRAPLKIASKEVIRCLELQRDDYLAWDWEMMAA